MDLAFVFDAPQHQGMECMKLTSIPMVMVSSEKGLTVQQAVSVNYILIEWGTSFSIAHAKHFPDMMVPRIRVMLGRLGLDYLLVNGGSAYMAEPMVTSLLKKKKLFRVNDAPVISREVYAIYPGLTTKADLVKAACDYFKATVTPAT